MSQNLTNADSALKEDYQPAVREQINNTNMLLMQIEKNTTDFEGRRAVLSLHVSRNSGIGARAEGATLPSAGNQGYAEERVPCKYNYGRIQISGPVIRAMDSDKGSFVRAVDSELKGVTKDLKRDYNRQLFGDGTGAIAQCGTTSTANLIVLATTTTAAAMRQFEVGEVVDIGTAGSHTAIATGVSITAVSAANKTITVSGSTVSTTSSHFVYRSGVGATDELTGLAKIVKSSASLFNVDPATYPVWASYVDTNSGTPRSISENLMEKTIDEVGIRAGEAPNLIITTHGVRRAYSSLLTSLKRFNDTQDLRGGFKALTISAGDSGDTALVVDRDAKDGKLLFLNTKNLTEFVQSDWEFMNEDGAVLSRVANTDAYEATLFKYSELATDQRNAHGLLEDITEA